MKFMRSHMIIWGRFFRWGLSPHTPCSFTFHIYFLDRTYPTSSCVAFTFRRCLCRRKRCLKRYGSDLNCHSPLFYLDLLPFSYITLYTYTPIDVFYYCCIVIFFIYTSIHAYAHADNLADIIHKVALL